MALRRLACAALMTSYDCHAAMSDARVPLRAGR